MERLNGRADAVKTLIGHLPTRDALDSDGLDLADADLDTLLSVDPDVWKQEAAAGHKLVALFEGILRNDPAV